RNNQHVATLGERHALRKRPQPAIVESNRFRLPPVRPAMRQVTLHLPPKSASSPQLAGCYPGVTPRKMHQPARVIGMQVRDHHLPHVAAGNSQRAKLRPDFLLRLHRKPRRTPKEGMPSGVITPLMYPSGLSGIHHDNSLGMIDHPSINRKPLRPPLVKKYVRSPRQSLAA